MHLDYNLYRQEVADRLTKILQDNRTPGEPDVAQTLAHDCAWEEPDAVDKVLKLLDRIDLSANDILNDAKAWKAKELARKYMERAPASVKTVDEILTGAGMTIDTLFVAGFADVLDYVERIDRLGTIAESRRNASLREIDRRRAAIRETLRRSLQQVEEAEYQLVETPPAEGENRA